MTDYDQSHGLGLSGSSASSLNDSRLPQALVTFAQPTIALQDSSIGSKGALSGKASSLQEGHTAMPGTDMVFTKVPPHSKQMSSPKSCS